MTEGVTEAVGEGGEGWVEGRGEVKEKETPPGAELFGGGTEEEEEEGVGAHEDGGRSTTLLGGDVE